MQGNEPRPLALVVSPDHTVCAHYAMTLARHGFDTVTSAAPEAVGTPPPDVSAVIVDPGVGAATPLEFVRDTEQRMPDTPLIVVEAEPPPRRAPAGAPPNDPLLDRVVAWLSWPVPGRTLAEAVELAAAA